MGYRFSDEFIQRWEKRLVLIMCIGIAAAFALAGGGMLVADSLGLEHIDSPVSWALAGVVALGLVIGVVAVVGVLFVGAVLGGLALHRLGWIPGLLLAVWMFGGFGLYSTFGGGSGFALHLLGFAPMVAAFIWMGRKAKVPIYLRSSVPGSPRLYLSEGEGNRHRSGVGSRPGRQAHRGPRSPVRGLQRRVVDLP